ncbi:MAG: hypothetical protein CVU69_01545 [Deltaproteobacteria bacterium HGW-Deltaproteobacteria-4]|nr:MAG: hypothetical protein CVU69_01545 [Deltaproteobacteria bacterium HGW-Deltaproteobacteria-4]
MRLTLFTVLLLLATICHAALPVELNKTFQPVDGVVIKGVDGEYLLDLGSDNGVRNGDLIAVMAPGETVKHPVSGAVIGQLDHAKAFLRIVRIKPDFAWARLLSPTAAIHPADPVRRFGEVPALLIDQSSDNQLLLNELQLALPHLAWQPQNETTLVGPGLIFTRDQQTLTVRDDAGSLLGSWPLTPKVQTISTAALLPIGKMTMIGPQFKGKAIGVAIADFDGNGEREVAVALDDRIEIGRYDGKVWTSLSRFTLPDAVKPLTLDSADIDGNGRFDLLVTAVRGAQLTSQIWSYDGTAFRLLAKDLPWFWRVIDLSGEPGVILGQATDPFDITRYADKPFRVLWQNDMPQKGDSITTFSAPTLHGSQPLTAEGKMLWAWLDSSDKLTILGDDGQQLWQGKESYGGGEAYIEKKERKSRDGMQRLFIRSRLSLQGETLILPQNDGPRSISNWRKADKSRLTALRWNGYEMEKVWESPDRDGYLADFAYGDMNNDGESEYLLIGTLATGLFNKSTSALFLWDGPKNP